MKKNNLSFRGWRTPANAVLTSSLPHSMAPWYREIIERSPHAFLLSVADGSILEGNASAADVFGYTQKELTAIPLTQLIDHTDEDLLLPFIELEKTGKVTAEAKGIRKNGQQFPAEISMLYFSDSDGRQLVSTMVTDISERKITEADIRLSNERYDMVVKATNDLVWDWDLLTGEIFRNCSGVEKVYGHRYNDSIKTIDSWSEYLHPADKEQVMEQLEYCKKKQIGQFFQF